MSIDNHWPAGVPLVSVVIPCFNYGHYLEDALASVLCQTFQNFEIIIVEGGSTDGKTPAIVRGIEAQNHDKVRVLYRSERHLAGDNRNFGIREARGRYICCLDADDILEPSYLEMAVFLTEAMGYDIAYSGVQQFDGATKSWVVPDAAFPAIAKANSVPTTALFRKSAWEHVGGYRDWGVGDKYIPEDWDFWVRMLGHGYRARSMRALLMKYRVHGAGLMATCETTLEHQRAVIHEANRELFENPVPPDSGGLVEIAGRWKNLIPEEAGEPATVWVAIPYISVGGAEQLFRTICEDLTARGLRLVITTSIELPDTVKELPDRYNDLTPHVFHLPKLMPQADWPDFLIYLMRRYRPGSLYLAGSEFVYSQLAAIRRECPNIRIVDQQFNDTGHIRNNRNYADLIDCTVVPSRALADVLMSRYGESERRIRIIPHGIDTRPPFWDRKKALEASGLPEPGHDRLRVCFFGRMSKEKSPDVFVRMAARVGQRNPGIQFVMTGEGPEWEAIKRQAAQTGLGDRLWLAGFVDDPRPLMELADIVVLPSALDGMPLVVLEAAALGKPVVATRVGSLPEMVVDGETGFLCPAGDVSAFAKAVETLAASPELRARMGASGREYVVARYGAEAMLRAYNDVLRAGTAAVGAVR
jgi:glycosyltransferase involved in cell wall biosynthesis